MFVLICYDVCTSNNAGKTRLRKIAKQCQNYGQRVQNSVFECIIEPHLWVSVKDKLVSIIKKEEDSLRFYYLGKEKNAKVEHVGAKPSVDVQGVLII
ncbi:MAG: CRISPR-associated endonuclease Cas2 [Defluviitaleaceae bacterium]|nr:CRISPR-associated endonuclease Cas2 [Defluviitaleaceae bacterium]